MRATALVAAAGLSIALAGAAHARPWNDPAGRLTFDAPAGWTVTQERGSAAGDTFTYVIAGTANNECQFFAFSNANTASANADLVRRQSGESARFGSDIWVRTLNGITAVFPGNSATVQSTSTETEGRFWPIQRAEATSPERPVHAALQMRPGFDIITLCMTYDGADPTALYDGVIRSVGHPNDAAFQAAAEEQAAARAQAQAQPQPAAEQPAEEQQEEGGRRNRRGR